MSQRTLQVGIATVIAVVVVVLFFIFNPFTSMQDNSALNPADNSNGAGVTVQDEVVGSGAEAQPGDVISVDYTGKLSDGSTFDTSVGKPPAPGCTVGFCFTLGGGQVIPGWDQGLVGMKVGGTRILIIPPNLAYGAQGVGPIPPNATLTFEVKLLQVAPAASSSPSLEGASAN